MKQSNHYPKNISINTRGENEYELHVDFDWFGITKDNKKREAQTRHKWHIVDNVDERFARVKQVDVQVLEGALR